MESGHVVTRLVIEMKFSSLKHIYIDFKPRILAYDWNKPKSQSDSFIR